MKIGSTFIYKLLTICASFVFLLTACSDGRSDAVDKNSSPAAEVSEKPQEKSKLDLLVENKQAFMPGSYVKGDIPKGEFIFVSSSGGYYAEEREGEILDNENFDSFGYVYNHGIGDITTQGVLVSMDAAKNFQVAGAKQLYELVKNQVDYNFSGHYKVGADIKPGRYIFESAGEAYVEVSSGPVGNGQIIRNEIFNGKKSFSLRPGQYVKVSRASYQTESKK